jgi:RNA polymerase sigma-70 factor (ECF subfamily)
VPADALARVLSEEALMLADGGGKVSAVSHPPRGGALIARIFIGLARLPTSRAWRLHPARINGLPGCLIFDDATGQRVQTIALTPSATGPGRIGTLDIQRNPDTLRGVLAAPARNGASG